jgi:hypothetical protein
MDCVNRLSWSRLWRIDAAREKLATDIKQLVDPKLTHAQIREAPIGTLITAAEQQSAALSIMHRLIELRARCQRHTNSFITPNTLTKALFRPDRNKRTPAEVVYRGPGSLVSPGGAT